MTVCGPVSPEDLGVTLSHEHLFLSFPHQASVPTTPGEKEVFEQPVSPANRDLLMRNPYAVRDNLVIESFETAVREVARFRERGGRSIIECTSTGIGRDPSRLKELSLRTGVNIVAGCGYYTADTHPEEVTEKEPDELAAKMIHDLEVGIDATGIRAGVIGEIGTSDPLHPAEKKVLRAAAEASRKTGAPIQVHTYPWANRGLEALDVLEHAGADPARVVICHTDVVLDVAYIMQCLRRGCFIQFDNFGKEFTPEPGPESFAGGPFARDTERVGVLKKLVSEGYAEQLLITNDVCFKVMLHEYGGKGYDHILTTIIPAMLECGIPREAVDSSVCGAKLYRA